ncbi:MAG: LPS export ABC transporter periplasmic protein LptC [Rhodospirillales bacterium]
MDIYSGPPRARSRYHARIVGVLKVALPLTATAIVALLVVWSQWRPGGDRLLIGTSSPDTTDDRGDKMIHARYVGLDDKGRPFSVTAETVSYLDPEGARMRLQMPKADITLETGEWLTLTADSGVYDRHGGSLDLAGNVIVFHDQGVQFRTSAATIDLEAKTAAGAQPVEAHGPFGELSAAGFRAEDAGRTIFFHGPATLRLPAGASSGEP